MRVKAVPVAPPIGDKTADVEVASGSLVVTGCSDMDVEPAESAVNPGLWGEFASFGGEEGHALHRYVAGGTPGSVKWGNP